MADFDLKQLEAIIAARSASSPDASWTARLLESGIEKCAEKMGEEAVETVVAAVSGDRQALIAETADLVFHLLVLLKSGGVSLDEVLDELESRTAVSGLEEKASRNER